MPINLDAVVTNRDAEKYAWPGAYPIAYLCDDFELLCADCVNDSSNPVHTGGNADGWRIDGYMVLEGNDDCEPIMCAHCRAIILETDDHV